MIVCKGDSRSRSIFIGDTAPTRICKWELDNWYDSLCRVAEPMPQCTRRLQETGVLMVTLDFNEIE